MRRMKHPTLHMLIWPLVEPFQGFRCGFSGGGTIQEHRTLNVVGRVIDSLFSLSVWNSCAGFFVAS